MVRWVKDAENKMRIT